MRKRVTFVEGSLASVVVFACAACDRHDHAVAKVARANGGALRREGLWRQTILRDGKATVLGRARICVDAQTDARMTMIGHAAMGSRCDSVIKREPDGSSSFQSTCRLPHGGGVVRSAGTVKSDFASTYRLHADSEIQGALFREMNGRHVTDIAAEYVGPCPADMVPGEMIVGPGLKVNLKRLPLSGAMAAVLG